MEVVELCGWENSPSKECQRCWEMQTTAQPFSLNPPTSYMCSYRNTSVQTTHQPTASAACMCMATGQYTIYFGCMYHTLFMLLNENARSNLCKKNSCFETFHNVCVAIGIYIYIYICTNHIPTHSVMHVVMGWGGMHFGCMIILYLPHCVYAKICDRLKCKT